MTALYFRCDAGREDGLGHLSRCLALAEASHRNDASPALFLTSDPEGKLGPMIEAQGHRVAAAPELAGGPVDLRFVGETLSRHQAEDAAAPVLVIDSRRIDAAYVEACRATAVTVCLDDEQYRDLPCDLLVNGNVWASAEDYPAHDGRRVLAGPAFNLIRADYFTAATSRERTTERLRVLITFGGEDPQNHTAWTLETMAELLDGHEVTVIIGPAHPDPAAVERVAQAAVPQAGLVTAPPSLLPFIAETDLAITAGGTTCYELAAARVPQAAIAVEAHQKPLIQALSDRGCLTILGSFDDLEVGPARRVLEELLASAPARARLAEAAAEVLPRSGLPAIVDAIFERSAEVH